MTFRDPAWHGITVRGEKPADVWADRDAVRAVTAENLRSYRRPW